MWKKDKERIDMAFLSLIVTLEQKGVILPAEGHSLRSDMRVELGLDPLPEQE